MRNRRLTKLSLLTALMFLAAASVGLTVRAEPDSGSLAGTYTREFTGAAGRVTETLEVKADKTVVWTSNYPGRAPLVQSGIWNSRGETLILVLDKRDGEKMPAEERLVFDRKGKNLKGRIYDKNVHGNSGLVFHRAG